jgi:hypothetical protein
MLTNQTSPRPLHLIAADIAANWRPVNYAAAPYLDAMRSLATLADHYGCDPADHIVRYFLSNARSWRGEHARRIKAELNDMLKPAAVSEPRCCYYIPFDGNTNDGFIPSLVVEHEPGHSPMSGKPGQEPWYWGNTRDEAQAICDNVNARQFDLSKTDTAEIVCSSMFAKLDRLQ